MERNIQLLKGLTGKKYVLFTDRGNISIKLCLSLMKEKGIKNLIIQYQGGWITYKQFARKYKLNVLELATDYGLINDLDDLNKILHNNPQSALLINSMPAYAYLQEMDKLEQLCKKNNIILINDASGSIGSEQAKHGDLIFASFGRHKPVDLGYGSFIATDNKELYSKLAGNNTLKVTIDYNRLYGRLARLNGRITLLNKINQKIKKELGNYDIIHKEKQGFNIIVKYKNDSELSAILSYCERNKYEFVLCPKYIKVLETAVSIEVVRL